ncbi:MAG: hypothetical protein AAFY31_13525, partial [Pseudomonadota bacterium]
MSFATFNKKGGGLGIKFSWPRSWTSYKCPIRHICTHNGPTCDDTILPDPYIRHNSRAGTDDRILAYFDVTGKRRAWADGYKVTQNSVVADIRGTIDQDASSYDCHS